MAPGYREVTADRHSGLVPGKVKALLAKLRVRDTGTIFTFTGTKKIALMHQHTGI